jgi:mxaJ protein
VLGLAALGVVAPGHRQARAREQAAPGAVAGKAHARGVLRVCSDPNNLPFSDREQHGFENAVARLLAEELGYELEYYWFAQRRGFFRNTLGSGHCDVVMGVPVGSERAQTTRAYYRSSYFFVQRRDERPVTSLDDPALRRLRIGVQLIGDDADNTPPAHALAHRNIVDNVHGFMVYGDYSKPDPVQPILHAVVQRDIDVAVVWGPLAGYYVRRTGAPLVLRRVTPAQDGELSMSFAIGVGVRSQDTELRELLDRALQRRAHQIDRVLDRFGVPRLAEAR